MLELLLRAADSLRDRLRRRTGTAEHAIGKRGEDIAHRWLRRNGYIVVARNYRTPSGSAELDIAAWQGDTLVFVEVKTRSTDEFSLPERNVDEEKMRRLRRAARDYIRHLSAPCLKVRFDIVSVVLGPPVRVQHIADAFPTGRM